MPEARLILDINLTDRIILDEYTAMARRLQRGEAVAPFEPRELPNQVNLKPSGCMCRPW